MDNTLKQKTRNPMEGSRVNNNFIEALLFYAPFSKGKWGYSLSTKSPPNWSSISNARPPPRATQVSGSSAM